MIDAPSVAWLSALPERRVLEGCELVHGSPREPLWEYIVSPSVARDNLAVLGQPIGLHGHTHIPVAFVEDDGRVDRVAPPPGTELGLEGHRALVNPGSVGQPRDGDPTASYMIFDPTTGTMTWHRVGYDIGAVQAAMREAGLPGSLISRLSSACQPDPVVSCPARPPATGTSDRPGPRGSPPEVSEPKRFRLPARHPRARRGLM